MQIFTLESDTVQLISLNAAFATLKNGRRVRSKEYKIFARRIAILLNSKRSEYEAFEAHFNPRQHEIHATLEIGVSGLYTKAGTISKNSGDIANFEKCLLDCVMVGSIDDSNITHWEMMKLNSDKPYFKLTLEIVQRSN